MYLRVTIVRRPDLGMTPPDSQGRDNKLHVWARVDHLPSPVRPGGSAVIIDTPEPKLEYSLDVNALNFCRFSFLPSKESDDRGLIALPNLIDSDVVGFSFLIKLAWNNTTQADIWALQKQPDRIHAAVGQLDGPPPQDVATGIRGKTGWCLKWCLPRSHIEK